MSEVTDLGAYREKQQAPAFSSGPAKCLHCGHTWEAVAPVGTFTLDCPSCKQEKGIYAYPFCETGYTWACKCGNGLFQLTPYGAMCIKCGLAHMYKDL